MNDEPAIDSGGGFVRLRLDIAYDGTEFAGWAVQAGQRTVAGVLDDALSTVFRVPVRLRAAGRTDAGVHATGQVAHVDVPADALSHAYPRTTRAGDSEFLPLVRRLARFLPADVRVLDIDRAAAGFDARFSALRRHYVYRLSTAPYGVEPQEARLRDGVAATARRRRDVRRRRETWWGCTTSPRSAASARAPPRSAICSGWTGHATATASPRTSAPTRSVGRWCARWSERCWRSASTAANPVGAPRC